MSLTTDELVILGGVHWPAAERRSYGVREGNTEVEAVIEVEVEEQVSNAFTFWLYSLAAGTIAGIAVGLAVA